MSRVLYLPRFKSFEIPSESDPGEHYTVMVSERGECTCTCPAYEWSGVPTYRCKHIRQALGLRKAGQ